MCVAVAPTKEPPDLAMKAIRFLVAMVCSAALCGCKVDLPHKLTLDDTWTITTYQQGRANEPKSVRKGSLEQKRLLAWAGDNVNGWSLAFATFSPDLLVTGPSFRLNVRGSFVVFGSGLLQYSKEISQSDYQRLRDALAPGPG
jgi:hypothetical protein